MRVLSTSKNAPAAGSGIGVRVTPPRRRPPTPRRRAPPGPCATASSTPWAPVVPGRQSSTGSPAPGSMLTGPGGLKPSPQQAHSDFMLTRGTARPGPSGQPSGQHHRPPSGTIGSDVCFFPGGGRRRCRRGRHHRDTGGAVRSACPGWTRPLWACAAAGLTDRPGGAGTGLPPGLQRGGVPGHRGRRPAWPPRWPWSGAGRA